MAQYKFLDSLTGEEHIVEGDGPPPTPEELDALYPPPSSDSNLIKTPDAVKQQGLRQEMQGLKRQGMGINAMLGGIEGLENLAQNTANLPSNILNAPGRMVGGPDIVAPGMPMINLPTVNPQQVADAREVLGAVIKNALSPNRDIAMNPWDTMMTQVGGQSRPTTPLDEVVSGVQQTIANTGSSFTTPENVLAMPAGAARPLMATFGASMAHTLPEQVAQSAEVLGDVEQPLNQKVLAGLSPAVTAGLLGMLGAHANKDVTAPSVRQPLGRGQVDISIPSENLQRSGEAGSPPPAPAPMPPSPAKVPATTLPSAFLTDVELYNQAQARMKASVPGSPEFMEAWKESETIKNRNEGMPPGQSLTPDRTIMDAEVADLRHSYLPWFKPEERKAIIDEYLKGGDPVAITEQAKQKRLVMIQQQIAENQQKKGQYGSSQEKPGAPAVRQEQGSVGVEGQGQVATPVEGVGQGQGKGLGQVEVSGTSAKEVSITDPGAVRQGSGVDVQGGGSEVAQAYLEARIRNRMRSNPSWSRERAEVYEKGLPTDTPIKPPSETSDEVWQKPYGEKPQAVGMRIKPTDRSEEGAIINPAQLISEALGKVTSPVGKRLASVIQGSNKTRQQFVNSIRTGPNKATIARLKDAADNQAAISGQQARRSLETTAKLFFGADRDKALAGATAAVEANGDVGKLDEFISIAKAKGDQRGLDAAEFAKANWNRIQPLVQELNDTHVIAQALEEGAGFVVGTHEGYIKHAYDLEKLPAAVGDQFLQGGGGSGGRGFMKMRSFHTLYDAIEAGYGDAIKSWNAGNLVESRVASGQRLVNDTAWMEGMSSLKDPTTGNAIVAPLIKRENKQTGQVNMVPPPGYEVWSPVAGKSFAVHRGYAGIFRAVTDLSKIREFELAGIPVGDLALKTAGGIKHSMLMFDSFHAVRMAVKGASLGVRGYNKGLSLLELPPQALHDALKLGDIDQATFDYALKNRPTAEYLTQRGLNIGRVQEGLDSEVVTHLLPKVGEFLGGSVGKSIASVPGVFNHWVFQKLTRGMMMETAIKEFDRLTGEKIPADKAADQVVKEVNTFFGNLGRQGTLRSATMQDLGKLVALAPQWVDSMARTETGAASGMVKYLGSTAKNVATGKPVPTAGPILKGTSATILAMIAATQLINMATRGQPTWKNEEEGHKLDAWIPSIGGGEGYWFSPLSLPMELTHDVVRYTDQGKSPLTTVAQIAGNKVSPVLRATQTAYSGRDYAGRKLSDTERVATAAANLLPLPLAVQPLVKGSYPGQMQRQATAMGGIKIEPVTSKMQEVMKAADKFKKANNIPVNEQDRPMSVYGPLKQALAGGDMVTAKEEYAKLLEEQSKAPSWVDAEDAKTKALDKIASEFKRMKDYSAVSKEYDEQFIKSLSPHQQKVYEEVKLKQKEIAEVFFDELQSPPSPFKLKKFGTKTFDKKRR